jgi:hypothetical protein
MNEVVMVTITKAEYDKLVADANFLECLEGAGVDNWEGWDFAREEFDALYGEDK